MKYVTDHKWKPFLYRSDLPDDIKGEYPDSYYGDMFLKYNKVWYALDDFSRADPYIDCESCPINPIGMYAGSAFHSVLLEISDCGNLYRICLVKS